jgi:predicted DCC family thiol-disulfide oxidoreductase YuxK
VETSPRPDPIESPAAVETAILLYDETCGVCKTIVAAFLAWDRRRLVRPLAIQTSEAEALLPGMPREQRLASWHLVTADGRIRSAGEVFSQLFRLLPGGAPFAFLAGHAPRLSNRSYTAVARRRATLGRLVPATWKRWAGEQIARRS